MQEEWTQQQETQPAPQLGPQPAPQPGPQPAPQPGPQPAPQLGPQLAPQPAPPAYLPFRRVCSRVGWAFSALMVLFNLGQALFLALAGWLFLGRPLAGLSTGSLTFWLCNDLALYGLGAPVCWLALRRLPRRLPPPSRPARYARMTPAWAGRLFCLGELCMFAGSLLGRAMMAIIGHWAGVPGLDSPVSSALDGASILTIFVFCVLVAPVGEELLMRGLLFRCLAPFGERGYILISAALFAAFHANLYQIPGAFFAGMLLAWLYCRTGRLRWGMLLHAALNFCGAVMPCLAVNSDALAGVWVLALLGFCIVGVIYLCRMHPVRQLRAMSPLPGGLGTALLNSGMLAAAVLSALLLAVSTLGSLGVLV